MKTLTCFQWSVDVSHAVCFTEDVCVAICADACDTLAVMSKPVIKWMQCCPWYFSACGLDACYCLDEVQTHWILLVPFETLISHWCSEETCEAADFKKVLHAADFVYNPVMRLMQHWCTLKAYHAVEILIWCTQDLHHLNALQPLFSISYRLTSKPVI